MRAAEAPFAPCASAPRGNTVWIRADVIFLKCVNCARAVIDFHHKKNQTKQKKKNPTKKKTKWGEICTAEMGISRRVLLSCAHVLLQSHSDGESQRSNMEREDTRSSPSTPSTPSVCSPTSSASSVPSTGKNVCASCGLEILDRYLLKVRGPFLG